MFAEGKTTEQVVAICERLCEAQGTFLATRVGEAHARALLARFGRHARRDDQSEVGMIAQRKPVAGVAGAAWPPVLSGILAQQRLRARLSKFEFAHALPALYQDRVGQSLPQLLPIFPGPLLPVKYHGLTYS